MKRLIRKVCAAVLAGVLITALIGCESADGGVSDALESDALVPDDTGSYTLFDEEIVITIDANGVASWKPVEGAVAYNVAFVYWDDCPVYDHEEVITETSVQLQPGYGVIVAAINENGEKGFEWNSEYFGERNERSFNPINNYNIDRDSLITWKVVENIDYSSVEKGADGHVYFNAISPEGNTIRFVGSDLDVKDGQLVFHKHGVINTLDSVGRIYSADAYCSDPGSEDNWITLWGGYDVNLDPHPGTTDNMIFTAGSCYPASDRDIDPDSDDPLYLFADFQPNFVGVGYTNPFSSDVQGYFPGFDGDVTLSEFTITYAPESECTKIKDLKFDTDFYGYYLEGELYDKTREVYDPNEGIFTFYLLAIPDLKDEKYPRSEGELKAMMSSGYAAFPSETGNYTIGDLKDGSGNVIDKDGAALDRGATLTVDLGVQSFDVDLEVCPLYTGAHTMHDLVPYAYPEALGEMNVLMIPISWQDESENATPEKYEDLQAHLGRIIDRNGKVTDYSDLLSGDLSLSEYYDIASYGQFTVNTFMTDWYCAPYDFDDMRTQDIDDKFQQELLDWFYANYGDMDMSKFDKDANGYIDSAILINIGDTSMDDGFVIISFGGAINYGNTYGAEYAGTPDRPTFNHFVNMNADRFDPGTLQHEFAHGLGLIDYYDVSHSGIDAVGHYDLQSANRGDWNVYSKYSVGWIEPKIVDGLTSGQSVDITIGSFGTTGDSIIVPVDGNDPTSPFCEYIAINLFSDCGLDGYYADEFGLANCEGVRIYHIDGRMEYRDYVPWDHPEMEPVPIGTIHYANDYKESGCYNVELIQAGGVNTFTDKNNLRPNLLPQDFFHAGDVFTLESYRSFFFEGKTDCGMDFGYSIRVISISGHGENAQAVIRVTRL